MIDAKVKLSFPSFLEESKLNERDPANDMVDALVDKTALEDRLNQWAREGLSRAAQGVDEKGMAPSEWAARLRNYYENHIPVLRAQEESNVYLKAQDWTSHMQQHIVRQASQGAIRDGYLVLIRLLTRLIDEMEFVQQELESQAATKRSQVSLMSPRISQVFNVGASKLDADDPAVSEAAKALKIGATLEVDADRFDIAAELVKDISQGLLEPLLKTVRYSRAQLSEAVNGAKLPDGRPNNWPLLPQFGNPLPTQMLPGATERVLIKHTTYENVLQQEVQGTLTDKQDRNNWRKILRQRAALGQVLDSGEYEAPGIISGTAEWVPMNSKATASRAMGAQAEFKAPRHFETIINQMEDWVSDVKLATGLARFLKQGLVEYVESGTPEDQVKRQTEFISAFQEVVQIAAPFVEINAAVKAALHPNVGDSNRALVSTIPFVEGHALYARIKSALDSGGFWSDSQSPEWFETSNANDISLFTISGSAMLPMVFNNLMRPIAQSWAENCNHQDKRHAFWSKRRARPLAEFIPAGPRQIMAMTRGWFLAGLLNQRVMKDEGTSGWKVQTWDVDARGLVDFPFPLLSSAPVSSNGIPAAVLKSLAIAMVKVNELGNLQPLRPYQRLIELGNESGYRNVMEDWIKKGTVAGKGAPTPDVKIAGSPSGTIDERREAVVSTLEKTLTKYKDEFAEVEDRPNPYTTPPVWELRHYLIPALDSLIAAALAVRDDEGTL